MTFFELFGCESQIILHQIHTTLNFFYTFFSLNMRFLPYLNQCWDCLFIFQVNYNWFITLNSVWNIWKNASFLLAIRIKVSIQTFYSSNVMNISNVKWKGWKFNAVSVLKILLTVLFHTGVNSLSLVYPYGVSLYPI